MRNAYVVLLGGLSCLRVFLLPFGHLGVNLVGQVLEQTAGLAVLGRLGQVSELRLHRVGVGLGVGLDEGGQLVGVLDASER